MRLLPFRQSWAGGIAILLLVAALFIFLRQAFAGLIFISPIFLNLGWVEIRWYGVFASLGILIGFPWLLRRANRFGLTSQAKLELVIWWAIGGGVIGARAVYVLQNSASYFAQPASILAIADGGLSIHGMLLGGIIIGAIAARRLAVPFWRFADSAVPPLLTGMILGRFGNFTNGELIGYPTNLPWKMFVAVMDRPLAYAGNVFFHPIFLYDAILNSMLLVVLIRTEISCRFKGEQLFRFLVGISCTRFVVEFWRINEPSSLHAFSSAQAVSIIIAFVSIVIIVLGRRQKLRFERI